MMVEVQILVLFEVVDISRVTWKVRDQRALRQNSKMPYELASRNRIAIEGASEASPCQMVAVALKSSRNSHIDEKRPRGPVYLEMML